MNIFENRTPLDEHTLKTAIFGHFCMGGTLYSFNLMHTGSQNPLRGLGNLEGWIRWHLWSILVRVGLTHFEGVLIRGTNSLADSGSKTGVLCLNDPV